MDADSAKVPTVVGVKKHCEIFTLELIHISHMTITEYKSLGRKNTMMADDKLAGANYRKLNTLLATVMHLPHAPWIKRASRGLKIITPTSKDTLTP